MSPDELAALWEDYVATRDQTLRDQLLLIYMPLVPYVVRRITLPAWVDREDFISYGYLGLIDAVSKFKPSMNNKFETYATKRIRGAILDGQRAEDPLTRSARRQVRTVHGVHTEAWETHGREASREELMEATGLPWATITHLTALRQTWNASFEDDHMASELDEAIDIPPDVRADDPELTVQIQEVGEVIAAGLANLGKRERTFVALYYGSGMSLKEVGERMGVSDARAGQIRLSIITALRTSMT